MLLMLSTWCCYIMVMYKCSSNLHCPTCYCIDNLHTHRLAALATLCGLASTVMLLCYAVMVTVRLLAHLLTCRDRPVYYLNML
jgi:hypothetical protein